LAKIGQIRQTISGFWGRRHEQKWRKKALFLAKKDEK
jgi:hypothetical protein